MEEASLRRREEVSVRREGGRLGARGVRSEKGRGGGKKSTLETMCE